jgi:hypothetical protein
MEVVEDGSKTKASCSCSFCGVGDELCDLEDEKGMQANNLAAAAVAAAAVAAAAAAAAAVKTGYRIKS